MLSIFRLFAIVILLSLIILVCLQVNTYVTVIISTIVIFICYFLYSHKNKYNIGNNLTSNYKVNHEGIMLLFTTKFYPFYEFNPLAYDEAKRSLIALLSLQGIAESHQLYTNSEDMRRDCLNALQSILISIEDNRFIQALQDEILDFDLQLQNILNIYQQHLSSLPITTKWSPPIDTTAPSSLFSNFDNYNESNGYAWFL